MPEEQGPDATEAQTWMAELELLKHFGAGGNASRAAELSARSFEAITASPAS
jgi:hypothetical protein